MQLVMFDIDGTLVDSSGFDGELFARAVRDVLALEVDRTWQSYRNVTDSGILGEIIVRHGIDSEAAPSEVRHRFIELVSEYLRDSSNTVEEVPGAGALLSRLQAMPEFCLAIATGGWRETAEMKLAHVGIEAGQIPLATSSDAEARADIMRHAEQLACTGQPFARRTYFGDRLWDRNASAELGYNFIGIGARVDHPVRFMDLRDQDEILSSLRT
jgi:phosphoglycolate phosphatase-like HAD superfamily hydrolase